MFRLSIIILILPRAALHDVACVRRLKILPGLYVFRLLGERLIHSYDFDSVVTKARVRSR